MIRFKIFAVLGVLTFFLSSAPVFATPPPPDLPRQGPTRAQIDAAPDCDVEKVKDHLWNKPFRMPTDEDYRNPALYCHMRGATRRYFKDHPDLVPISIGRTAPPEPGVVAAETNEVRRYATILHNCLGHCGSSIGHQDVFATISGQAPTLDVGQTWQNFLYGNRVHFGVEPIFCDPPFNHSGNIAIGLGYGANLEGGPIQDGYMRAFVENWIGPGRADCYQDVFFSIPWNPNVAMATHIWVVPDGTAKWAWVGAIWYGGGWYYLVDIRQIAYSSATWMDLGQELWAGGSTLTPTHVPLNFVHKIRVVTKWPSVAERSFHEWVLPAVYQSSTGYFTEAPFTATDVVGLDWTSISSEK